mgnify:FL=1
MLETNSNATTNRDAFHLREYATEYTIVQIDRTKKIVNNRLLNLPYCHLVREINSHAVTECVWKEIKDVTDIRNVETEVTKGIVLRRHHLVRMHTHIYICIVC